MRVRLTRPGRDEVDGVQLAPFEPSRIYDIRAMLAVYLIAIGIAEPVEGIETSARDRRIESGQASMVRLRSPS